MFCSGIDGRNQCHANSVPTLPLEGCQPILDGVVCNYARARGSQEFFILVPFALNSSRFYASAGFLFLKALFFVRVLLRLKSLAPP